MKQCYFCEQQITSRYRVMESTQTLERVLECRSCERLQKRLAEKNLFEVHNKTGKPFKGYKYVSNGDVRAEQKKI